MPSPSDLLTVGSVVILSVGFGVEMVPLLTQARPKPAGLGARICLWIGTVGLWAAVWVGEPTRSVIVNTALSDDGFLRYWVAGVFTALSLWRGLAGRRADALLALVWFAGLCVTALHVKGLLFTPQ